MRSAVVPVVVALLCATAVRGQETSLTLISQPGDFIGQGLEAYYTPANATIGSYLYFFPKKSTVEVEFNTPHYEHYLSFYLSSGSQLDLGAGSYAGATSWPGQGGSPGMSIFGDGRGCNSYEGQFHVRQFTTDANGVASFWATFEQHCEGGEPALTGEVRFNAVPEATSFFTVSPCRLLDTRTGGNGPALVSAARRIFTVSGLCGIPATAKAVAVNTTVTGAQSPGYLTLFAGNLLPPAASTINFSRGQTRTNNAILPLATDGAGTLAVYNGAAGGVQAIVDVFGYFE
ncbi:MAG TPA: hypothetical protein VMM92_14835 [Thermoanaerobaculia bacterium]|nr:hypothetical protein [Thermoanaerobaculia bacterium]